MGPIGCTETSVRNYHFSLCNIQKNAILINFVEEVWIHTPVNTFHLSVWFINNRKLNDGNSVLKFAIRRKQEFISLPGNVNARPTGRQLASCLLARKTVCPPLLPIKILFLFLYFLLLLPCRLKICIGSRMSTSYSRELSLSACFVSVLLFRLHGSETNPKCTFSNYIFLQTR
jgi:hypothetical protein